MAKLVLEDKKENLLSVVLKGILESKVFRDQEVWTEFLENEVKKVKKVMLER